MLPGFTINPQNYIYATKKVWGFVVAWASDPWFSYEFWSLCGQDVVPDMAWLHTCESAGPESSWRAVTCSHFQSFCIQKKLPVFIVAVCFFSFQDVVTKYSNFVSFPVYLNGRRINTLQVRPSAA